MKKVVLTFAVVMMSTNLSLAENPHVGEPANIERSEVLASTIRSNIDYSAPASVVSVNYSDGSADRFDDASPSSRK